MTLVLPYAHCYCEENTYVCLEKLRGYTELFDYSYAIFMSSCSCDPSLEVLNQWSSIVPYRSNKKTNINEDLVVWDYHVIAAVRCASTGKWFVIDHDSFLPCSEDRQLGEWRKYCIDFAVYSSHTFLLETQAEGSFSNRLQAAMNAVRYRLMRGNVYLCFFRSDRSHMLDGSGKYTKQPPPWPPVSDFPEWANTGQREEVREALESLSPSFQRNNITSLVNMGNTNVPGVVMNRDSLLAFFS